MEILFLLGCSVDQAGIRRRIPRLEFLDGLEIACVGDYDRELFELIELAKFGSRFFLIGGCGSHRIALLKSDRTGIAAVFDHVKPPPVARQSETRIELLVRVEIVNLDEADTG